jgi:hypothetical protein
MGVARGASENKHILFVNPIAILLLLAYVQFLESVLDVISKTIID